MKPWERLLVLIGLQSKKGRRYYELDASLHTALVDLAEREQRPVEEVQADLLARALAQQHMHGELWERWQWLSPREQEVTAFTCLGYTNRQIAAKLSVSEDTVKGYVRQVLVKFRFRSKDELRVRLGGWDFSKWGPEAQD
jgi:DNA-binding CsgD family transcriptional regulator